MAPKEGPGPGLVHFHIPQHRGLVSGDQAQLQSLPSEGAQAVGWHHALGSEALVWLKASMPF